METWSVLLTFVLGIGLRLAIPLGFTAVIVMFLRRLDARWQAEAEMQPHTNLPMLATPCWQTKGCSAEQRAACPATQHPEVPCWQARRQVSGRLPEACLTCAVFRSAPVKKAIPVPVHVTTGGLK